MASPTTRWSGRSEVGAPITAMSVAARALRSRRSPRTVPAGASMVSSRAKPLAAKPSAMRAPPGRSAAPSRRPSSPAGSSGWRGSAWSTRSTAGRASSSHSVMPSDGTHAVGEVGAGRGIGGQDGEGDGAGLRERPQRFQQDAVALRHQHGQRRVEIARGVGYQRRRLLGHGAGGRRGRLPLVDETGGVGEGGGTAQMGGEVDGQTRADGELGRAVGSDARDLVQQRLGRGQVALRQHPPALLRRVAGEPALGQQVEQRQEGRAALGGKPALGDQRLDVEALARQHLLARDLGHRPMGDGVGERVEHQRVVGGRHVAGGVEEGVDARASVACAPGRAGHRSGGNHGRARPRRRAPPP